MNGPEAPRRRRRTEIQTELRAAPEEAPVQPAQHRRRTQAAPLPEAPQTMARPKLPEKPPKEAAPRLPRWLLIGLTASAFCAISLLAASMLMQAYLHRRAAEWEAAYQAVVDRHPLSYRELIGQYAEEYNLNPAYVAAIILNESSFRPDAESGAGARGLMQLMPDTAEWIAGRLHLNGYSFGYMYDPGTNIRFGCWYLNYLSRMFRGDPIEVTAAYHAGQGTVTGWLSTGEISPDGVTMALEDLPEGPTKTYVRRVTRDYGIYQALYYPPEEADSGADPLAGDGAVRLPAGG